MFKVVTIAGALSEHLVTPRTKFTLPYSIQIADRRIHDAELRGTETMTVAQILQRSSNVGAVTIADKLLGETAPQALDQAVRLRSQDRHRLSGREPRPAAVVLVRLLDRQRADRAGHLRDGIQLASVYAAIANDGKWVQPHLVDHIQGEKPPAPRTRRILKPGVDRTLLQMLKGVVSETGTAVGAEIPGYTVAGKTGTAQKPRPDGYEPGKYVATFVGMVPASNPRLVVLVSVDEPHGAIFGGIVSAPAFAQIAGFDLQYLEVPPDLRVP